MTDDYTEYSTPELVRMLGARFKDYRLRADLTQKEVAETTGLSVLTIHRFENGTATNVSLGTFPLICIMTKTKKHSVCDTRSYERDT